MPLSETGSGLADIFVFHASTISATLVKGIVTAELGDLVLEVQLTPLQLGNFRLVGAGVNHLLLDLAGEGIVAPFKLSQVVLQ
jgi:hypothetical protein